MVFLHWKDFVQGRDGTGRKFPWTGRSCRCATITRGIAGGLMRSDRSWQQNEIQIHPTPTVRSDMTKRVHRRALLRASAVGLLTLATGRPLSAAALPNRANTSREAQDEAIRDLPLDKMRPDVRAKLTRIVSNPTLFRRLPQEVIDCDPEMYLFLVRHPEVVVNMWQLMGITKVTVRRVEEFVIDASDGAGTQSRVELLYGSREKHLFYAQGHYEGPLLRRRVNGECVLLLQSGYGQTDAGRVMVSNRLDVFVTLENVGAEFVAKTLHPLVGRTADHNFAESAKFVGQVSQQAEVNEPGMLRLAQKLTKVEESVRGEFAEITTAVNERAVLRGIAYQPNPMRSASAARTDDAPQRQ